ncbi:MAG: methionyl-tRNA formyltransferase [candidate division Zixibacteria bacterium RBG_16_53_22]|nr:MAG: methionyl-tRNA formyltransferase [candidate division Zixibacteria bacterium RBG_16_53_22]
MRLVFFGTPEFASRCLEKILSSKHQVAAVVTAPDKPRGRGMRVEVPDVKRLAQIRGLKVLQPLNLSDPQFIHRLSSYNAELFCVVAFRILPEEVFAMPPAGCINLHASLLPRYRGAAPINWAIINGERETGLTTFFIRRNVDTGDMIMQEKLQIKPDETFGDLHDRLADLGGELLIRTIDSIEAGDIKPICQDNALATSAPKITPRLGNIDWTKPAREIHNLIRGLSPRPGAYTARKGRKIILLRCRPYDTIITGSKPGEIIKAHPQTGIVAACGTGSLEILELRPESGKTMSAAEYVRGHRLTVGEVLEKLIG